MKSSLEPSDPPSGQSKDRVALLDLGYAVDQIDDILDLIPWYTDLLGQDVSGPTVANIEGIEPAGEASSASL